MKNKYWSWQLLRLLNKYKTKLGNIVLSVRKGETSA